MLNEVKSRKAGKKLFLLLATPILFLTLSCQKMDMQKDHEDNDKVEYRTVDATINANETYTYALPENKSDDPFQITTQAMHAKTSTLENNATTYRYTPATNFTGTDKVMISAVEEQHNGGHHSGGGMCNGGHHHAEETELVITINLTVNGISIISK